MNIFKVNTSLANVNALKSMFDPILMVKQLRKMASVYATILRQSTHGILILHALANKDGTYSLEPSLLAYTKYE